MPLRTPIQGAGLLFIALLTGCGRQPTSLSSRLDIMLTPASETMIDIGYLPIEDYPRLAKFKNLQTVNFYNADRSGANDEKLKAFSQLDYPQLIGISLTECSEVTDEGVRYLSHMNFSSFGVSGAAITDASLEVLSSHKGLTGLGICDCRDVTWKGICRLVASSHLDSLGLTLAGETQEEVAELIRGPNTLTYLVILLRHRISEHIEICVV